MGRAAIPVLFFYKPQEGARGIRLYKTPQAPLRSESEANEGAFLFLMARRLAWRSYLKDYGGQRQEKKQKLV
jgi:hypothetical protein